MTLSTKISIFDKGEKDIFNVEYSNGHLLRCNEREIEDYDVEDGTEVICDRAFAGKDKLVNIYLPESVKVIGESAFSGCKKLEEINIPDGVEEIKTYTFRDCGSLKELTLPESIKKIDRFAFDNGLKVLTLLSPDAQVHRHAFLSCKNLEKLIVPEGSCKHYRTILAEARIPAEVVEMNLEKEISLSEDKDNKEEILTNKKEEIIEKLNFPGYSTLVLSGKGYVIEGIGDELIQYYAVFTSNLKVEFNGEDVTDKVKTADRTQFLASKFMNDIYDGLFYYGDDEIELPKSIFLLPEGTEIEDINLIPVNGDFRDWDKGGIVADFIDVDDEEQEAQSFLNNVQGQPELPAFEFKESKYDDNRDFYSNYYSEDNETSAYRIW